MSVNISIKKIDAYNKILDVIAGSTIKEHKDVAYIMIELFVHRFEDTSLSEQLLEIADKELSEL